MPLVSAGVWFDAQVSIPIPVPPPLYLYAPAPLQLATVPAAVPFIDARAGSVDFHPVPPPLYLYAPPPTRVVVQPVPSPTSVPVSFDLSDFGAVADAATIYAPTLKRFAVAVTNQAGSAVDPLAFRFRASVGGVLLADYSRGADVELVRDSAGNYHVDLRIATTGTLTVQWESTQTGEEAVAVKAYAVAAKPIA